MEDYRYVIRFANASYPVKVDNDNVEKDDSTCSAILNVNILSNDEFQSIRIFNTSWYPQLRQYQYVQSSLCG